MYILVSGVTIKLLFDNETTNRLVEPLVIGWGLPRTLYIVTIWICAYILMLRLTRDMEPNKRAGPQTFVKAVFVTVGMVLFVMGAQALRS